MFIQLFKFECGVQVFYMIVYS